MVECVGSMNSHSYIENVLKKLALPLLKRDKKLVFQQDNAPCHTAKKVKKFFTEKKIKVLKWPANSPDLKIIENIWRILKFKLNRIPIRSKAALIVEAKAIWKLYINKYLINKLLESMPRRIQAVIDNKGYNCKY